MSLDSSSVVKMTTLDSSSETSVVSSAVRGFAGEMLFGPLGLAATITAKQLGKHIVNLEFQDKRQSVIEVDDKIYYALKITCSGLEALGQMPIHD